MLTCNCDKKSLTSTGIEKRDLWACLSKTLKWSKKTCRDASTAYLGVCRAFVVAQSNCMAYLRPLKYTKEKKAEIIERSKITVGEH